MQMGFRRIPILLTFFLTLALLVSTVPVPKTVAAAATVFKKVSITKASYIQLTDANLIPSASGATASFTFSIYNGDSSAINLVDYWVRLKTAGGTKYTLSLLDADKKKKVLPKTTTTLTYYSEVGSKVTLDQLVVNLIKFDFSVSGYEKTIGQFTFPKGYSNFVKSGGFKGVLANNSLVNIRIDQINVTKSAKNYNFNLTYVARNTGKFGVALPQYNYYAQTANGLYKLSLRNKSDETLTLEPSVLNAVQLTGSIPLSVATSGWKLIVTNNVGAETNKVELPVVIFDIPFKVTTTTSTSTKTTFTNDDGTYEVELSAVQRLPWNNDDNVIADLIVRNNGSVYLPLPDLTGLLIVDDNIKLEVKAIKKVGDIGLAPGASTTISYVGSIPYNYTWKKFKISLSQKAGETVTEIGELTRSTIVPVKKVELGAVFVQQNNGAPYNALVTDVKTYSGEKTDMYAVYIEMTNKQKRIGSLPLLAGYFKTSDGNLYEAKFTKATNAVKSESKDQLIVWTELPQNVERSGIQLLMGEAFDDKGLLQGAEAARGYLRAAQFVLPEEKMADTNFRGLKVGPYTINMNYFNVWLNGTRMDIKAGADVQKDINFDGYTQSQFSFEIEHEATNQVLISQVIDLEGKAENSLKWKAGANYSDLNKEMGETLFWNEYQLNIYESFNGNRKKLASMPITFSPVTNWLDGSH
ncbi:hypothetical protein BK133_10405 [Paenibacillus sp. FSL H8-0548]|uniref:hypothetical protein n=1 Tax=Paenibacillus sp. FSL H8-0548 TaxID=1920422 RepID=UPI00096CD115|nr:hypothetical protein [Paenibacillus sp. FSL H8-0548]OMF35851.1 hypothetical protein BK133_10405 [Paenibacillus sp. FSL H8-0548]